MLATGTGPPVDLDVVAGALSVQIVYLPSSKRDHLGKLEPVAGGFRVKIFGQQRVNTAGDLLSSLPPDQEGGTNARFLTPQGRFSLAHEFGHALFYGSAGSHMVPRRIAARYVGGGNREEGLCHDFARALLMPMEFSSLVGSTASIHGAFRLAKTFAVGREPVIRRILHDWAMWQAAMFVRITLKTGALSVRCFRGKQRKGPSKQSPTGPAIGRELGRHESVSAAAEALRKMYDLPSSAVAVRDAQAWALL